MVYINSWQKYQEAAENLYANAPRKTRYSVKWKSSEGKLVLKITDDVTCLKFKTHSSIFLGRFEALNRSLIQKMMNTRPPPPPAAAAATATATAKVAPAAVSASQQQVATGSKSSGAPAASTGGGVKKKKGKKK